MWDVRFGNIKRVKLSGKFLVSIEFYGDINEMILDD